MRVVVEVYAAGVVFLLGVACGERVRLSLVEWASVLAWPVSVPAARLLSWWQWGSRKNGLRAAHAKWWQRGKVGT